jgi:cohesin complex subunit SA-1/2
LFKFESFENRASRLSASLGVGTIKDKALAPALAGFIREGVRFAFSAGIEGTEESIYAGDRLLFLLPLSK